MSARFLSAHACASTPNSTAYTVAFGASSAMALAIAPEPVQRSTTVGDFVESALIDGPAGEKFGLRAGYEHPWTDLQFDVPEGGDSGQMLQRLTRFAP